MKKVEKKQEKKEEMFSGKNFWIILPLIVVCAIIAGIFGQTIGQYYISDNIIKTYQSNLDLSGINPSESGLVIRDAKKVVVNEDVKISETINSVRDSLVGVFEKKDIPSVKQMEGIEPNWLSSFAYYNLNSPLFNGLVITSDGWVFMPYQEDKMKKFTSDFQSDFIALDNKGEVYQIDEILIDKNSNLAFFHLKDAKNMNVKKNASRTSINLGQTVLAIKDRSTAFPGNITSFKSEENISDSEVIDYRLKTNFDLEELESGFIFNLAGDLLAFVSYDKELVPAFSHNHYWQNFLEKKDLNRPYLGVNYLDLSLLKIVSDYETPNKGALLWGQGKKEAVELDSPAEKVGLQEGDLITWVNNIEINESNDLSEIISLYYPGDQINIVYKRNNLEYNTNIVLEELKNQKDNIIK